mmetsp:Transcript_90741/g.211124  ORF Transcript_90741/g.211124 Transcript_90741/m.211124 type:complete len:102 (-) Transcript_90741:9-314(-)
MAMHVCLARRRAESRLSQALVVQALGHHSRDVHPCAWRLLAGTSIAGVLAAEGGMQVGRRVVAPAVPEEAKGSKVIRLSMQRLVQRLKGLAGAGQPPFHRQ